VGSGIGGVIALLVGTKKEFATTFTSFFLDCPKFFKLDFWKKLGLWLKTPYDEAPLTSAMKTLFGETTTLYQSIFSSNPLVVIFSFFLLQYAYIYCD
jgi:hypothetical protein